MCIRLYVSPYLYVLYAGKEMVYCISLLEWKSD